jgi:hypothetical protein
MRRFITQTERLLMYSKEGKGLGRSLENKYRFQMGMEKQRIMKPLINYLMDALEKSGYTARQMDKLTGTTMASKHWFCTTSQ